MMTLHYSLIVFNRYSNLNQKITLNPFWGQLPLNYISYYLERKYFIFSLMDMTTKKESPPAGFTER